MVLRLIGNGISWAAVAVGCAALLVGVVALTARRADGPIGPFPGGPFRSGDFGDAASVDWSALSDVPTIELQLLAPLRSRTTWLLVQGGVPYVPCAFPTLTWLKHWPRELERDARVVIRIRGKRYRMRAVRVTDSDEWRKAVDISQLKYHHGRPSSTDDVWYFRLEARPDGQ
jgi:hypothetical protein